MHSPVTTTFLTFARLQYQMCCTLIWPVGGGVESAQPFPQQHSVNNSVLNLQATEQKILSADMNETSVFDAGY